MTKRHPLAPPRCILVTGAQHTTGPIADVAALTLPTKQAYCDRWGHELVSINGFEPWALYQARSKDDLRWFGFARMRMVERIVRQELEKPEAEHRAAFVMWIDADAAITNPDLSLPALLNWFGPKAHCFATEDCNGLHTGTFAFRVSALSAEILAKVWESGPEYDTGGWFEQGALAAVIASDPIYQRATCLLPKRTINGYPRMRQYADSKRDSDFWRPGDFIMHAPGLPYEVRAVVLAEAIRKGQAFCAGDEEAANAPMPRTTVEMAASDAGALPSSDEVFAEAWRAQQAGRYEAAEHGYRYLLSLAWDEPKALQYLVNLLIVMRRDAEALVYSKQLCAIVPRDPVFLGQQAALRFNVGEDGREAGELLRQAVAISPGCALAQWNLALHLLREGKYKDGFAAAEWEPVAGGKPMRHLSPAWDGEREISSLYLYATQGLGDVLMFLRFVPRLHDRSTGAPTAYMSRRVRIVLEVQTELLPLLLPLQDALGIDRVVARPTEHNGFAEDCDGHLPLASLPRLFGVESAKDIPQRPYLAAPPLLPPADHLRVGVCWKGQKGHGNDRYRSLQRPTEELAPALAALTDAAAEVYSLVPGEPVPGTTEGHGSRVIRPQSVLDTACLIASLDLVVTVDSMVAHLAGAMGKPVLLFHSRNGDWRWGRFERGAANDWYPTIDVLRQEVLGEWGPVMDHAAALIGRIARRRLKSEAPEVALSPPTEEQP